MQRATRGLIECAYLICGRERRSRRVFDYSNGVCSWGSVWVHLGGKILCRDTSSEGNG